MNLKYESSTITWEQDPFFKLHHTLFPHIHLLLNGPKALNSEKNPQSQP